MKLLTKAIIKKLEKTRYDKEKPTPNDAPVLARFFNPTGSGTWSVLEGEKLPNNDWRFFGVVDIGQDKEYGYFNLSQLEDFKGQFGLGIERDRNFKGTRASLDKEYGFKSLTRSKKDKPEDGKQYRITGKPDEASISRGDSWKASEVGKQMPLMIDLNNKKEVNSATVAGVPVNNSKNDKTPTQVESLLNRVTSWRKKNKLGDSKVNQKDYVLDKAFTDIKKDTEIIIQQLRKETGSKKEQAKNLIQLLENSLYGKGKKKKPNEKKVDKNLPDVTANNFKTKTKGNYPHRVAWLQANGSWVSVDLNNRTMTTSLELKNVLKAGDITEKEINKSLSWMQIEDVRARPNSTFRILKESSQPPKDINYMSFGKNDIKVTKNGFAVFENRNHNKHYGADGEERAMKYKRSNYKYPRANNRYSIWNSRKRSSQGQVGFKILRKKK